MVSGLVARGWQTPQNGVWRGDFVCALGDVTTKGQNKGSRVKAHGYFASLGIALRRLLGRGVFSSFGWNHAFGRSTISYPPSTSTWFCSVRSAGNRTFRYGKRETADGKCHPGCSVCFAKFSRASTNEPTGLFSKITTGAFCGRGSKNWRMRWSSSVFQYRDWYLAIVIPTQVSVLEYQATPRTIPLGEIPGVLFRSSFGRKCFSGSGWRVWSEGPGNAFAAETAALPGRAEGCSLRFGENALQTVPSDGWAEGHARKVGGASLPLIRNSFEYRGAGMPLPVRCEASRPSEVEDLGHLEPCSG